MMARNITRAPSRARALSLSLSRTRALSRAIAVVSLCALCVCPVAVRNIAAQDIASQNRPLELSAIIAIDSGNIFFPQSVGNDQLQAVVYQEADYLAQDGGAIYLSAAIRRPETGVWQRYPRFSAAVNFTRDEPPLIFSALATGDGALVVALLSDSQTITIYGYAAASDEMQALAEIQIDEITVVAPRLFERPDGGVICFFNSREENSERQSIYFTVSRDTRAWSEARIVAPFAGIQASFLPDYAFIDNREIIVFQSLAVNRSSVHQLYFSYSDNGGARWSPPRLITQFLLPDETRALSEHSNQRPTIVAFQGAVLLAWERRALAERGRIIYTQLNRNGDIIETPIPITTLAEQGLQPQLHVHRGRSLVSWSGGQGDARFVALSVQNQNNNWVSERVGGGTPAAFPSISAVDQNAIRLSWAEASTSRSGAIYTRNVALRVPRITLGGANFIPRQPSNKRVAIIEWRRSQNFQDLNGFRYTWAFETPQPPSGEAQLTAEEGSVQVVADQEGLWYFTLQAQDLFGNWLEPLELQYRYDITAPDGIAITEPELDADGFVVSNTFSFDWRSPNSADIAGYYVDFERLGDVDRSAERVSAERLSAEQVSTESPETIVLNYRDTTLRGVNIDNGLWRLRVATIDRAGNSGPLFEGLYQFNKYIAATFIYGVSAETNASGLSMLTVNGKGFLEEGRIVECVLDADRAEPYDYRFASRDGACDAVSDSTVRQIPLGRIRGGSYFIGLSHNRRGLTFSNAAFELLPGGTVLFGEFDSPYSPRIEAAGVLLPSGGTNRLGAAIAAAALLLFAVFLFLRLLNTVREGRLWKKELQQLDYGGDNQYTEAKRMAEFRTLRRKGASLRIKFTVFITLLVITIVFLISIILGSSSLRRQERILATSLQERISVLLDSISAQAGTIFLNADSPTVDLEPLVNQLTVLEEAQYITITGATRDDQTRYGAVWQTNDPRILNFGTSNGRAATDSATEGDADANAADSAAEGDTDSAADSAADTDSADTTLSLTTDAFLSGESELRDQVSEALLAEIEPINADARTATGSAPQQILDINQESVRLILESAAVGDAPDPQTLEALDAERRALIIELNATLRGLQSDVQSYPLYDAQRLDRNETSYLFYRPIVAWNADRVGSSGRFYQGAVRIGISTEMLLQQLDSARNNILLTTLIIAIVATFAGIIGASLLAAIVIAPIRAVVRGVEVISSTEDKSDLREHVVAVRSKDELSVLAQSINQMTRGLVQASDANKELIVGKDIQKLFIPLIKDKGGNKLSVARDEYDGIEIGGYYEGAHGVSGDYFSYSQLDQDHFVIIKCDVSGKGVPAALIMVGVATIFSDFVREGTGYRAAGALSKLAQRINDLLEGMQFQGRFAALTMAIINQKTGQVGITNAGDRQVHAYRHAAHDIEVIELPETPAAGVFPSEMIPNGFVERQFTLHKNDCLLFFTDGIDESRRLVRNADFSVARTVEGARPADQIEEFGVQRIHDITKSVMSRSSYRLTRERDTLTKALQFDYRQMPANAISLVKAIIAAERVFRLHPLSALAATAKVPHQHERDAKTLIDKEIAQFLSSAFNGYPTFFGDEVAQDKPTQYRVYRGLYEEDQYDDLTILAVRKK